MSGGEPRVAALEFASNGFFVLPLHTPGPGGCSCRRDCDSNGKHPRTEHGVKDATTDPEAIRPPVGNVATQFPAPRTQRTPPRSGSGASGPCNRMRRNLFVAFKSGVTEMKLDAHEFL